MMMTILLLSFLLLLSLSKPGVTSDGVATTATSASVTTSASSFFFYVDGFITPTTTSIMSSSSSRRSSRTTFALTTSTSTNTAGAGAGAAAFVTRVARSPPPRSPPRSLPRSPSTTTTTTRRSTTSTTALSMGKFMGTTKTTIRTFGKKVRDTVFNKPRSDDELKIGIAGFYDRSSKLWEDVWGEHMHHGYYVPPDRTDHVQAQIDLIDEVLKWSYNSNTTNSNNTTTFVPTPKSVVDVGCGIGGSSRHIATKYGPDCLTEGLTLSPYQANRATQLTKDQNLNKQCHFQVADALSMPFDNNKFDLVWSLESGEHMPNKTQFVNELWRVCTVGGRIIVVTWCHRDLDTQNGETR